MSSAYKKALEKKKSAEVSLFDQDKAAGDSSSSGSDEDRSDSESVKDVGPAKATVEESDENQLRAFRDQDPASKEWKNR